MHKYYILYNLFLIISIQPQLIAEIHANTFKYSIVQADHNSPINEITSMVNTAYARTLFLKLDAQRTNELEISAIARMQNKKLFLCLDDKSSVCGTALLDLSSSSPEMSMLAVHPKYQKQNIGKLLMQYVEQELVKLGYDHVLIYIVPFSQAQLVAYYQKNGYRFLDTTLPFTHLQLAKAEYQDQLFFKIMRKDLVTASPLSCF